jgi:hypothetical protein
LILIDSRFQAVALVFGESSNISKNFQARLAVNRRVQGADIVGHGVLHNFRLPDPNRFARLLLALRDARPIGKRLCWPLSSSSPRRTPSLTCGPSQGNRSWRLCGRSQDVEPDVVGIIHSCPYSRAALSSPDLRTVAESLCYANEPTHVFPSLSSQGSA